MNQVSGQARATLEIYMKLIKIALSLIIFSLIGLYFIYLNFYKIEGSFFVKIDA